MATATKESRAAKQLAHRAGARRDAASDAAAAARWLDEGGSFSSEAVASATLIGLAEALAPPSREDARPTYSCPECGHVLRVSGLGRHRVYFELGDERSRDPMMDRACPVCGHALPGKNPR